MFLLFAEAKVYLWSISIQNLCYVAHDYEAELRKDTRASSDAAGEGQFTLSRERFQTGEISSLPRKFELCLCIWPSSSHQDIKTSTMKYTEIDIYK